MRRLALVVGMCGVGALAMAAPVAAQTNGPAPVAVPDEPHEIYVVTFGPGDHPFFKFGHQALLVRDRATGRELVYNFGTFRFAPGLVGEFLKGRLTYWLSVAPWSIVRDSYEREDRTISVQELALGPAARADLVRRLDENARPENREYKYDYFRDNCTTRVRDAVDRAAGGALYAATHLSPGRLTLREQALRMTADVWWLHLALDLVLAGSTDRPISRWDEMYIPEELARGLHAVTVEDGLGPKPLVASERMIAGSTRPPPRQAPPERFVTMLLAGLALGLVFVALGWGAPASRLARAALGLLVTAWGLVVGFVGSFLVYVWVATDHVVAHRNENIFQCAPFALALGVLGLGVAWGSRGATLAALRLAVAALLLAALGWGLKALPPFHQHNASLIAFFLPAWLGVAAGLLHARHAP